MLFQVFNDYCYDSVYYDNFLTFSLEDKLAFSVSEDIVTSSEYMEIAMTIEIN